MDLIQESYLRLFPEAEFSYLVELEYNRRLSDFNANIRLAQNTIKINLNLQWKDIDSEIKIGLIQQLLLKVLKKKMRQNTPNIELYNNFIKNIPLLTEKNNLDPQLEASFERVNNQLLSNSLEKTNLMWGRQSFRKLAHYNFHNDSITVSAIFKDAPIWVLDYIMYHEMLHKFHKFQHQNGRSSFHSHKFKEDETKYPNYKEVETEIQKLILAKRKTQRTGLRTGLGRFF